MIASIYLCAIEYQGHRSGDAGAIRSVLRAPDSSGSPRAPGAGARSVGTIGFLLGGVGEWLREAMLCLDQRGDDCGDSLGHLR